MAKFTYKEIKEIIAFTPKEVRGKQISSFGYNTREQVGSYHPSTANWSYIVFALCSNREVSLVVTRFGEIL